jgi:hypothetical protein
MTGSAKQSRGNAKNRLLRRCAPRNDGALIAGDISRFFCILPLLQEESEEAIH